MNTLFPAVGLFISFGLSCSALGQDFYQKDFARAPGISGDSSSGPIATQKPSAEGERDEGAGKKILGLGLIAQGLDSQQAMANLETYATLLSKYNLSAGTVQILGFQPPVDNFPLLLKVKHLAMLGVVVNPAFTLSKKYKITRSPSWILTLEDGEVVLEGLQNPESFINKSGEFIEPADYLGMVKEDVDGTKTGGEQF